MLRPKPVKHNKKKLQSNISHDLSCQKPQQNVTKLN